MKEVSTSILWKKEPMELVNILNDSLTDYIHLDVMDGKFVNNKFLTISEIKKILEKAKKKVDIHLMVSNPIKYIEELSLYNISYISVHYENPLCLKAIELIKSYGLKPGIAISPNTNIKNIFPLLDKVSLVLVMSVYPGKSGQTFMDQSLRIKELKDYINNNNLSVKIEIDGGIKEDVLHNLSDIDIVVSSSYVWEDLNNINKIKES